MNEIIANKLAEIRNEIIENEQMLITINKANGGNLFLMDLWITAILHRSQSLIEGFCIMIENKNFDCAAPLVRLQLDNCLRFFATALVDDRENFISEIMKGKHIRKIKDKNNEQMTDKYLYEKLSNQDERFSFIKTLYIEASGFIHVSEKNILKSMGKVSDDGKLTISLQSKRLKIDDEEYIRAIDAFKSVTEVLKILMEQWVSYLNKSR